MSTRHYMKKQSDILKNIKDNNNKFNILFIFIILIYVLIILSSKSFISTFFMSIIFIPCIILLSKKVNFNSNNNPVFDRFNGIDNVVKIVNELESNYIYKDNNIIFNKDYIMDINDYSTLIKISDIYFVSIVKQTIKYNINFCIKIIDNNKNEYFLGRSNYYKPLVEVLNELEKNTQVKDVKYDL